MSLVLQRVGADLVEQSDAAPFVEHVNQHAVAGLIDQIHRNLELLAAVTARAAEHIAGQALRMQSHQRRPLRGDFALDQCDAQGSLQVVAVDDEPEATGVTCRQYGFRFAPDLDGAGGGNFAPFVHKDYNVNRRSWKSAG